MEGYLYIDTKENGVILASDETELEVKMSTLLDGIREPIKSVTLPSFNDFNDMEPHEVIVEYGGDDNNECFFIQRVNPI